MPNLESAVTEEASAQSSTITETEVESAESVPVSDEPVVPSVSEEVSSLTLAEISTDQTSPDINTGSKDVDLSVSFTVSVSFCFNHTKASSDDFLCFLSCPDPVAESVPAETKTTTASEEIPAPAESEEPSDTKQAAENGSIDTSPAESTPSIEPVASVEAATAESAPVEAAPVESTPVAPAPDESAPVERPPLEAAAVEAAAVEAAPVEAAPVEAASVEAAAEAAPMEAAPVEAASIEAAVVEVAPVEVAPVEVAPVEASPEEEVKSVPSSEEPGTRNILLHNTDKQEVHLFILCQS